MSSLLLGSVITTHEAAANPHSTYATDADLTAHGAAADPHPGYAADADLTAHEAAADPHPGYAAEIGAWTDWTPTFVNLTVGNGVTTAKHCRIGRLILFELKFVMGSTSAMGTNPTYTLPVAAAARYTLNIEHYGTISILDSGTAIFGGMSFASSTTVGLLGALNASATYASISGFTSTVPMTWATGDAFMVKGSYEAAA